jgi:hypothetical protein
MSALKGTTDKVVATTKQTIEIIGDAKLHEAGKTQQRKGVIEKTEQSDVKPLGNLDKLT